MRSPHIILAGSNVRKVFQNLQHILGPRASNRFLEEIERNTIAIFRLGEHHYKFALQISTRHWRQRVSRFYYSVYNVRKSVAFHLDGNYVTDVSDHKNVALLPDDFPNKATYAARFNDMRNDRNLADYSHEARIGDLVITQTEAEGLAKQFLDDASNYLRSKGVRL